VLWAWLKTAADAVGGWQGAMSVPRVVEAGGDGRSVVNYPIPELSQLHDTANMLDLSGLTLSNASTALLALPGGTSGRMLDIKATISFSAGGGGGSALSCGFRVLMDPENPSTGEGTNVLVSVDAPNAAATMATVSMKTLTVDVSDGRTSKLRSTNHLKKVDVEEQSFWRVSFRGVRGASPGAAGELSATLRILVDSSVVESFVDGGAATHTALPVPSKASFVGLAAVSTTADGAGSCTFDSLRVYPMSPFQYDIGLCASSGCLYP
jgi:sucrose-6-phosphate hydrolase SacC (GH32 family)